jgi:hypothetical protein
MPFARRHHRCFDRILLSGLIQPFQQPESVVRFINIDRQLYLPDPSVLADPYRFS